MLATEQFNPVLWRSYYLLSWKYLYFQF